LQWQRFSKPASQWQRETEHVYSEGRKTALQYIVNSSKTILDVGCGIGLDYLPLSNLEYYGVDVTPRFINEAHRLGVPCQIGSALNLPFKDTSFDTVYCRNLLLHLPPDQVFTALNEMLRVAKKQVVTVEPQWEDKANFKVREFIDTDPKDLLMFFSNTYAKQSMQDWAEQHGLTLQTWTGYDEARSNFLHKPVNWQVTVYTKKV
jgi:ubiquinone/menaquinone biosynthesis C-methylase UbiE